jgi:hypothetical protein
MEHLPQVASTVIAMFSTFYKKPSWVNIESMIHTIPWGFSIATAVWFGWVARRAGSNWLAWALGGGAFSLAITTMILGVSQAAFIPLSHDASVYFQTKSIAAAALVVGSLGWCLTRNLRRLRPAAGEEKDRRDQAAPGQK